MSLPKSFAGNWFEDFKIGQELTCPIPRTLDAGTAALYTGLTGDRTAAFSDARGLVHPLVVFHAVFGQTVRQISLNAVANLGYAGLQWHGAVRYGQTLTTRIRIVGLKENSNRKSGVVYVHNTATDEAGRVVMTFWRWVMVRKRGDDATPYLDTPVVPTLPEAVDASSLVVDTAALSHPDATGGCWALEDYMVGERIHHHDGMAINPSDHMTFTRLFQNSAKVHFDAVGMKGQPLVYGGVIISHAYAMALNGLENRLGLVAVNAGAHANPTYAGDTVYAYTDVLEVVSLSGRDDVGALRLRLVAVKNLNPAGDAAFAHQVPDGERPGKTKYHPQVVLDLDLWELVPTRKRIDAFQHR